MTEANAAVRRAEANTTADRRSQGPSSHDQSGGGGDGEGVTAVRIRGGDGVAVGGVFGGVLLGGAGKRGGVIGVGHGDLEAQGRG